MSIARNLEQFIGQLPQGTRLVAVSKTHPEQDILEAYAAGQRIFGENRVQELVAKHQALPKDIEWHFIGHLQKNKAKHIAPFVAMVHAVDSLELLAVLDQQARRHGRVIPCLLQLHVAQEQTKHGMAWHELLSLLDSPAFRQAENVRVDGLMAMATFSDDQDQVCREFAYVAERFAELRQGFFADKPHFRELSMGMSGDWPLAVGLGSTLVRVGSAIFGQRELA